MTIPLETIGKRRPVYFFPPALTEYWAITANNPGGSLVYLLHFSQPIGSDNRKGSAQHYIGFCIESQQLIRRIRQHTRGEGAKITAAAVRSGGQLHIAAVWVGRRELERELKSRRNTPKFCPICAYLRMVEHAAAVGQAHFLDTTTTINDVEVPF